MFILSFLLSCKDNSPGSLPKDSPLNAAETNVQQPVLNEKINDILKVQAPQKNQFVFSPLMLEGEARGYWFFEADAPVELLDENFSKLEQSYISAIGEWMTKDWVEFKGILKFKTPSTRRGFLIFHKANPSGLKEHDLSDTLEIRFSH